jgi:thiol-disulfide isomerase/thioredoxin
MFFSYDDYEQQNNENIRIDDLHIEDEKQYKDFLKKYKNKTVFVWFYATWCGHCKVMKGEWAKLVNPGSKNITFVRINENAVKPEHNIVGYPTLRLYKNGFRENNSKYIEYNFGRDAKSFKLFLDKNTQKKLNIKSPQNKNNSKMYKNNSKKKKLSKNKKSVKSRKSN